MVENTSNINIGRKPYKLASVDISHDVINRLAMNESHLSIAEDHKVNRTTVTAFKKRNAEQIKLVKEQFIADNLQAIRNQVKQDIDTSNRISNDYNNGKEFHPDATAFKALTYKEVIKPILTGIDIFPSRTNINNFGSIQVNNQHNTVIKQSIAKFMGNAVTKQLQTVLDNDVIDVSGDVA